MQAAKPGWHKGGWRLRAMKQSATSGAADVTQVISPQCHSAHAHSQDGNPALRCVADAVGAHSQAVQLADSNHLPFIQFPSFLISFGPVFN